MYLLVKTLQNNLEIWSEAEYHDKVRKCEYYGAKPFWKKIKELVPPLSLAKIRWQIGEVVPYGDSFAVITELVNSVDFFKGYDIVEKTRVIYPISKSKELVYRMSAFSSGAFDRIN